MMSLYLSLDWTVLDWPNPSKSEVTLANLVPTSLYIKNYALSVRD